MKSRIQISLLGIGSSLIITSIIIGFGYGYSNSVNCVSGVYNNKTNLSPVVLTPNENYESHSLLTELRLINQLYFP